MIESPIEVIRRCQRAPNKAVGNWTVLPGLPEKQIEFGEANQGDHLPESYKALLRETIGIQLKDSRIDFMDFCSSRGSELGGEPELFPDGKIVMSDDCGNSWVVDTAFDPVRFGPVFFMSHDPAVIFYQAHDLSEFLDHILNGKRMINTDMDIWRAGESGGRREGEWIVYDLQKEELGSGAPLCLYYDDHHALERVGNSLVFRIRHRERNWWQRFRDRWR